MALKIKLLVTSYSLGFRETVNPDSRISGSNMSRRYRTGSGPRRDKSMRFQSTIRDIGGSGKRVDYQPRGDDEQPQTYDDVKVCNKQFDWLLMWRFVTSTLIGLLLKSSI